MTEAELSLNRARRVDVACDRFEAAWRDGGRPRIEDHLADAPHGDRAAMLRALLAVELELRQAAGEAIDADTVRARFPGDAALVGELCAEAGGEGTTAVSAGETAALDSSAGAAAPEPVPARVGRFEVRGVLGAGAFGRVYRAFDPQLGREVAVKVPLAEALRAEADRDRFLREARAAATVSHPNVCPVHEVGEDAGRPYLVMALIPGRSLADVLATRAGPVPQGQAVLIARRLASALDAAHRAGVVHRDLKPANVMVDPDRRDVVVTDFGLARGPRPADARGTLSGVVVGTPAYMAPEQARGDPKAVGPAADVYALGVILYELLTGRRPFTGTAAEVIGQILHVEPDPPSRHRPGLDPRLEAICLKAMAKDPAKRFASMAEFAAALGGAGGGDEELDLTAPAGAAPRRSKSRTWLPAAVGVLLAGVLLSLAGVIFYVRTRTAAVLIQVDVDLADPALSFVLDGRPTTAADLGRPVELTAGEHELLVKRGEAVVKRLRFAVKAGWSPEIKYREVEEPPPVIPPADAPADARAPPPPAEDGWVPLFNGKDLTGWEATRPESFSVDPAGHLLAAGDTPGSLQWLLTAREFSDYVLRLEFQLVRPRPAHTYTGVAIRALPGRTGPNGAKLRVAIRTDPNTRPRTATVVYASDGAIESANPPNLKPPGEWNAMEVEVRGPRVRVSVNGKPATDADLAAIDRAKLGPKDGWAEADLDRKAGRIGLQSFRGPVLFRNIRVKELARPDR